MQFHPRDLSELDELTEEHLGFSALSDGLGFSKKPGTSAKVAPDFDVEEATAQAERTKQMALSGTGAVAAGPARFSTSPAAVAAASAHLRTTRAPEASTGASVLQQPAAAPHLRISAFLVDAAIVFLPLLASWRLSFGAEAWNIFRSDKASPTLLYGLIFAGYFLLSESFGGQSLGKMLFRLSVVEDDKYQKPVGLKESAFRMLFLVVGIALAGLGLFSALRDPKRRPWHDRFTGSIVRYKP